ncbi:hypothetical protein [Nocardiopsis metallicus]|uniref:HTH-type transcriptional repressor KstR2 C-terminal domain-containing protein n=1 Tax=Nocardiopsis metallicus TaxID=179819 RepID=A0A840W1H9_9ACTN|nr:hypothetical protein [Nocardiopsis metallicus]MBB5490639.1 hypothetical protein [Nocardiopsis metallicus]
MIGAGAARGGFTTPYPRGADRAVLAMCRAVPHRFDPDGDIDSTEPAERYAALAPGTVGHRPTGRGRSRSRNASVTPSPPRRPLDGGARPERWSS